MRLLALINRPISRLLDSPIALAISAADQDTRSDARIIITIRSLSLRGLTVVFGRGFGPRLSGARGACRGLALICSMNSCNSTSSRNHSPVDLKCSNLRCNRCFSRNVPGVVINRASLTGDAAASDWSRLRACALFQYLSRRYETRIKYTTSLAVLLQPPQFRFSLDII